MMNYKEKVLEYYKLVDSKELEEMFKLFSNDVIYVRGEEEINGMDSLKDFYLKDRKLNGNHALKEIEELNKKVIVKGTFKGTNHKNDNLDLNFADFFYFNSEGLIFRRETYLANGFVLIM